MLLLTYLLTYPSDSQEVFCFTLFYLYPIFIFATVAKILRRKGHTPKR